MAFNEEIISIVVEIPEEQPAAEAQVAKAIELLKPYMTAFSNEDELSVLDFIENHDDFESWIAEEAREKVRELRLRE